MLRCNMRAWFEAPPKPLPAAVTSSGRPLRRCDPLTEI